MMSRNQTSVDWHSLSGPLVCLAVMAAAYLAVSVYLTRELGFNLLSADALGYWKDSLHWQAPFNVYHVPGYPLLIALAQGLTFGVFPPLLLMMAINVTAYLACGLVLYRILQACRVDRPFTVLGVLAFALWPFVGVVYAVDPRADMLAMLLLLLGIRSLQRSRFLPASVFLGLSAVVHKAMWPFVGLVILVDMVARREYLSWRNLYLVGIASLPVAALWAAGAVYYQSPLWILSHQDGLRVFDGLAAVLSATGVKDVVKGALVLGLAVLAVVAAYRSVGAARSQERPADPYGFAVSMAVLLLFLIQDRTQIWAAVRFSRLLVLPLIPWAFRNSRDSRLLLPSHARLAGAALLLLLMVSQFVSAWYMARVHFA